MRPNALEAWILSAASSWRPVLAVHAVVFVLFAAGLPRLAIDDSPQAFFAEDAAELAAYRDFQHLFGRDQVLRVVLHGPGLWTEGGLDWLARLERRLGDLPGAVGAVGPSTHHRVLSGTPSAARAEPGDEASGADTGPAWPPGDPDELRKRLTADPLDRAAGWVSADGELVTVMVVLYDLPTRRLRALVAEVRAAVAAPPTGLEAEIVGLPIVAEALDDAVVDAFELSFPLLSVFAIVLLLVVLRGVGALAAPLAFVAFVSTVVLGGMGWAGVPLDVVTSVLPPLLFVITLATSLYLLVEYRHRRGADLPDEDRHRAALRQCYAERARPVLWAGVTTAAGFGSLAFGGLPPVRALGVWIAGGIALATAEAFFLYPALLEALARRTRGPQRDSSLERAMRTAGRRLAEIAVSRRRVAIAGFALVAVSSALALPRLRAGTDLLGYFRPTHPVRLALDRMESRGIAVVAGEIVIAPREGKLEGDDAGAAAFSEPARLRALDGLTRKLRELPGALSVLSPYDLIAAAARQRSESDDGSPRSTVDLDPTDEDLTAAFAAFADHPDLDQLLASSLSRDRTAARVSLMVPMASPDELDPLFDRALAESRARFPGSRVWLTGVYPLVLDGQRAVLKTMTASLSVTAGVVALILLLITRSLRGLLACLTPNLVAVLFVLGVMAVLSIPVDATTLMIAAIVLGLAVDDTLHTLGAFRARAPILGPRPAAVAATAHTATGVVLTSATLVGGFLACGVSSFVPVARFGLLTAAALVFALIADLLLTPALLAGLDQRDVRRLAGGSKTTGGDESERGVGSGGSA